MTAPLEHKLQAVEWGEYRLGELFESSNGDFDIQKTHINGQGNYVITAGLTNNGVLGKTDIKAKLFEAKTITIDMFGFAFYRCFRYKMVTHARVFSLKPKFNISDEQGLFLASAFHFLNKKFGYENMCSWEKVKNQKVKLPVKDGKIDFDFMESFIRELEEERIRELAAYLAASGYDSYELTAAEQAALAEFDCVKWGEYKIGDLFQKAELGIKNKTFNKKTDLSACQDETHTIPVTNAKMGDNGVMFWAKESDFETTEMSIDIVQNGAVATGKVYPQPQETGVLWDSYLIKLKEFPPTKNNLFFLATAIEKSIRKKYCYEYKAYWNKVQDEYIKLPVKDGKIDFAFMELLASAVQKLVIKDVVLYADQKIAATKEAAARK